MSKKILKMLAVMLAVLMIVTSVPLAKVSTASAEEQQTKLYKKVTNFKTFNQNTDMTNMGYQYAIVVKYKGRYYAIQMVNPYVYGLKKSDGTYDFECHTLPANGYKEDNVNTANTRDVTNMIIEDNGESYLVGVDDSVLWNATLYTYYNKNSHGNSGYGNKGVALRSALDVNEPGLYTSDKYLYAGQVVIQDNSYGGYNYVSSTGSYNFWTINISTRGLNYKYDSSKGTGQLFSCGVGNYNYFLTFEIVDGRPKFDIKAENYTTNYSEATCADSAEILLFEATNSSSTISTTKSVNSETPIANKYIEYKWNYKGSNGAYQIVYNDSALGFDSSIVPVFIPATELQAGHAYVIASGTNTLKSDLSSFTMTSSAATAINDANPEEMVEIGLYDDFLNDGGSYWTADARVATTGEYWLNHKDDTTKYLAVEDSALFISKTPTSWKSQNEQLKCFSDGTSLYCDNNGWVVLETNSNVKLYDVAFASMEDHPATCIQGHTKVYKYQLNGKNYTCEYVVDETLDPTNHYSLVTDSTATEASTCVKHGYEGAVKCTACGEAVGYEKQLKLEPDAHTIGDISNLDGTHNHKCINKDENGVYCTYTIKENVVCTDADSNCICDVCNGAIPHKANEANCMEDSVCSVCKKILVKAKGHVRGDTVTPNGDGTHGYKCTVCNKAVTSETCRDINPKDCKCDVCGYQFEHVKGPAATCKTAQRCLNCSTYIFEEQKSHSFTGVVRCYYDGTHSMKCVNGCGTYGCDGVQNAKQNCYDENNDCKCDVCGYQMEHTLGAAATCSENQICTVCKTVITKAYGHDFSGTVRQNDDGTTHSYLCKNENCGKYGAVINGVQTENGKLDCVKGTGCKCSCGRQFSHSPNKTKATCQAAIICDDCHQVLTAQLPHSYTDTDNVRCNNDGTHSFGCVNGCKGYGVGTELNGSETCEDSDTDNDCKCDKCKYVMASSHIGGKAATCTTAQYCTICDEVVMPALGHNYDPDAPATYNEGQGTHSGKCTRCGASDTVEACYDYDRNCKCDVCGHQFAHQYNLKEDEHATCTTAKYCLICGKGDKYEPKKDHDFSGDYKSYSDGTHAYLCKGGCGLYGIGTEVDERENCTRGANSCYCSVCTYFLGHDETGADATCETAKVCKVCGTELSAKLGHDFTGEARQNDDGTTHSRLCKNGCGGYGAVISGEQKAFAQGGKISCETTKSTTNCVCKVCNRQCEHKTVAATCTTPETCSYCHTATGDKLPHDYSGQVRCNENGTHSYLCKNGCGTYSNTTVCVKSTDDGCTCHECGFQFEHLVITDKAVKEDCLNSGLTEGSHCVECGIVFVEQKVIPATNHPKKYDEKGKAATCFEAGIEDGTYCPDCEKWIVGHNVIPQLEHNVVVDKAVKATCLSTGLTEGSHCSICKTVLVAQTVLPASGHNYEKTVVAPTCKAEGYTKYVCSYCHDTYYGEFTTGDHVDKDDDGYCDECGEELREHEVGFDTQNCTCICHDSNGFTRFFYKIAKFFWKLFGTNQKCDCGIQHY